MPDIDDLSADWPKFTTWDIWVPGPGRDPPLKLLDTLPELLTFMDVAEAGVPAQRQAVTKFLALPAAQAMPERLHAEVVAFLGNDG